MMPLYALLTNTEASDPLQNLPMFVGLFAAVVLLIAFFIGFYKGFRKVGWGGCVWIVTNAAFFLLERVLGAENPLKPFVSALIEEETTVAFLSSFALALVCILVGLLLHGIFSLLLRPRIKIVKSERERFTMDENGIEYEKDEKDDGDYHSVRKGFGKPSVFGRIFGGLTCAINALAVLLVVLTLALFVVCATPLKDGALAPVFANEYMSTVKKYTFKYAFDFLIIGFILKKARNGFEKGFIESVRALVMGVGRFAGIILAFYLPFSPLILPVEQGGVEIFHLYVYRCVDAAVMMGLPATIAPIVGQIIAGLLLFVLVLLVFALLNFILKTLAEVISGIGFIRVIDGALACLVYIAIGAAICALICSAFYVVGAYGIFDVKTLLVGNSLAKKLLELCGLYIQPVLDGFNAMIAGLIPAA